MQFKFQCVSVLNVSDMLFKFAVQGVFHESLMYA